MVHRKGPDSQIPKSRRTAAHVEELSIARNGFEIYGEVWFHHLSGQRLAQPARITCGIKRHGAFRIVERREERQPLNVVPMIMRQEQMDVARVLQSRAQIADPGACVEDEQVVVGQPNFQARSVSTISQILRKRSGDGAADAPESQLQAPGVRGRAVIHELPAVMPRAEPAATSAAKRTQWPARRILSA